MDSLDGHRAQLLEAVETAVAFGQMALAQKNKGQTSLFDGDSSEKIQYPQYPIVSPWNESQQLTLEKEMLGFYISGHPLGKFENEVRTFASVKLSSVQQLKDSETVKVCGIVTDCKSILDRKNKPMAFVTLEDFSGSAEIIVFASVYAKVAELLNTDSMVAVSGRASAREEEETKILCNEVIPLDKVWELYGKNLHLKMDVMGVDDPLLNEVTQILMQNPGDCNLFINLKTSKNKHQLIKAKKLKVKPSYDVISKLRSLLGQNNVWMEAEMHNSKTQ
jgi:DNA polymerase-3 subunit alpha